MNHITSNISPIDIGLTAVLIMCLYLLYLRLFAPANRPLVRLCYDQSDCKILKQAKLGQFSTNWTKTGQGVHQNSTYHMIRPFDCTGSPRDSLKNERLCLKIVLGQTRFESYSPSYNSPCDHSFVVRIGSAC
jgi:hypothetical protein